MKTGLLFCAMAMLGGCSSVMGPENGLRSSSAAMVNPMSATESTERPAPATADVPAFRAQSRNMVWEPSAANRVVDASARAIPGGLLDETVAAFSTVTDDARSLQLRRLRVVDMAEGAYPSVCGEFRLKDGAGGHAGFHSFQYLPPFGQVSLLGVTCEKTNFARLPDIKPS